MIDEPAPNFSQQQMSSFSSTLLTRLPSVLSDALKLVAIPYWFDEPLLAALRGSEDADGRTGKIFDKLVSFSFVSPAGEGRYTLTPDLREFLRTRWSADSAGFAAANQRAADHFAARVAQGGPEAEDFEQARVYHLLACDGEAGIAVLRQVFASIEDIPRKAVAERLVMIAEEQRPFLSPAHRAWLDYFQARAHQMYGRWDASRTTLEGLLRQSALPALLRAHVQQALAEALTRKEQWVQAIQLYQQALIIFEEQNDPNAALAMLDIGQAYVDMGINVWGQRDPQPHLRYTARQRAVDLVGLPGRLPILAYLAFGLGPGVLRSLRSPLSLARNLDWMIARLFVSGALWYRRGGERLKAAGSSVGLSRLNERLGRLYHSLGHLNGAADTFRQILAQTDPPPDEYRRSRAQLGLGHVLLDQGHPSESVPLFEQALPALVAYDDVARQAQAHHLLGRTYATLGQSDAALEHYGQALTLYHNVGDVVGQTNAAHQLEEWATFQDAPAPAHEQATQMAAGVTQRRYMARYIYPALAAFRTIGLGLLAVVLFCTLFLSIRVETNTEIMVRSTVGTSALSAPSSAQGPVIAPSSLQNIRLNVRPDVALAGILLAFAAYTLLYTGLGLYLIVRLPLRTLQEGQSHDFMLDEHGLAWGHTIIPWDHVTGILNADHKLGRQPLLSYSKTVVFGPNDRIELGGNTGWYTALTGEIARRAPRAPRFTFGFSVIYSLAGWVFAASLLSLAVFIALSFALPDLLGRTLGPTPYPVADLRVLSYAALLVPLTWWLIVAPLRVEVFLKRRSAWPWWVLGIGAALTGVTCLTLSLWRVSLGLPGVIPALYAVSLMWIGVWAILRAHAARAAGLAAVLVTLLITVLAGSAILRETSAYYALMQGNALSLQGRKVQATDSAAAEADYLAALAAYTHAIQLNPADYIAYAGRGIVYGQMGQLEEALADYNRSLQINAKQPAVLVNRATIYQAIAARAKLNGDQAGMQTAYQQAIADLSVAISLAPGTARYYVQRGVLYLTLDQREEALADFKSAQSLSPNDPDVLNGLGWVDYQVGSQAQLQGDADTSQQAFQQAAQAFERATQLDPANLNNYNGQGWAYRELGDIERTRGKSTTGPESDMAWQLALEYYQKVEAAFQHASTQAPDNPLYHVSYGHALWLVSTYYNSCSASQPVTPSEREAYTKIISDAITQIGAGVQLAQSPGSLDQGPAKYYYEQGQLSYILYTCGGADKEEQLKQGIAYDTKAIEAEPDNPEYYHWRGRLTYRLAKDDPDLATSAPTYAQSASDQEQALQLAPGNVGYTTWLGYAARAGVLSYFELGRSDLSQNKKEEAYQEYLRGITLAQKLDANERKALLDKEMENIRKMPINTPNSNAQTIIALLEAAH